jgi:hypothetical protein
MRTHSSNLWICELANICLTFAIICDDFLYNRTVNCSFDIGDNEDLVTVSLILFRSPHSREVDVVVA